MASTKKTDRDLFRLAANESVLAKPPSGTVVEGDATAGLPDLNPTHLLDLLDDLPAMKFKP